MLKFRVYGYELVDAWERRIDRLEADNVRLGTERAGLPPMGATMAEWELFAAFRIEAAMRDNEDEIARLQWKIDHLGDADGLLHSQMMSAEDAFKLGLHR